ncbi:uncharacterized protein PV09_03787 [Verruconis gallopava]|uniref:Uncharacterized protein n=1 Tax=Verruconis gallopava TaxID=253628 RepID=A0A0D2B1N6_9PEZI|nr:uncharacterized protein PV09_03787 [Verruconis gallopava]KIW05254.1 hypothetical protein PV09_03787 [Verruconis gallopava]
MPYDLKNRNVLVTAGSRGLGALICEKFAAKGCNIAINYYSRPKPAQELSEKIKKEYGVKTIVIKGDGGVLSDCKNMVRETIREFDGLDIIVGNAGYTKFSNFGDLDALGEDDWDRAWHTNVTGQMWLLREALPTFNENPEGGVFLITSSVAGTSLSGSSMAYSVTKSAQLHLMRCLANTQGSKVRINAILPGLLLTEWGLKYPPSMIEFVKDKAALKHETYLDDCANMYVSIAENTSMTGQRIAVDAGLNIASL